MKKGEIVDIIYMRKIYTRGKEKGGEGKRESLVDGITVK